MTHKLSIRLKWPIAMISTLIRVYSRSQFWLFQLASINRLAKELKPQPLLEMHSLVSDVSGDTCGTTDVQHPLGRRRRQVETSFVITIYLVLHCLAGCWPFNRANGKVPVLSSLPRTFRETPPVELHFTRAHELRSASFPRQPQTALINVPSPPSVGIIS